MRCTICTVGLYLIRLQLNGIAIHSSVPMVTHVAYACWIGYAMTSVWSEVDPATVSPGVQPQLTPNSLNSHPLISSVHLKKE